MSSNSIFDTVKVGDMTLDNRVIMAPMATNLPHPDGSVSEKLIGYLKERAKGGVSFIITGYAYIDQKASKSLPCQLGIYSDSLIPGLNRLADEIHSSGTKCIIQIAHCGPKATPEFIEGKPPSPSGVPFQYSRNPGNETKKLKKEEINEIKKSFIKAASRAERADFDGVELHGAHNYLISQFLSPKFNLRQDRYGGSTKNRTRFLLEIIEGIKNEVNKDFAIGVRYNGKEFMEGGLDLKESVKIGQILEKAGIDYLNVSVTSSPEDNKGIVGKDDEPGAFVKIAAKINDNLSIPVAAVGGLHEPSLMRDVVQSKKSDLVAVGRGLLSDPNMVRKIKENREGEIITCTRCGKCSERLGGDKEIRCPLNPSLGRETIV